MADRTWPQVLIYGEPHRSISHDPRSNSYVNYTPDHNVYVVTERLYVTPDHNVYVVTEKLFVPPDHNVYMVTER